MYIVLCRVFSRNSLGSLLPKTDVCLKFYMLVYYYLCDKIRNHWLTKQASLLYSMQNKLVACKNVHWYQFERKIKLYTTDNTSSKKYIGFNDMNCAMPSPLLFPTTIRFVDDDSICGTTRSRSSESPWSRSSSWHRL